MNYDGLKFHIAHIDNVASHPVLRGVIGYFNGRLPEPSQRRPGVYVTLDARDSVGRMRIGNDVVDIFGITYVAVEPGVPFSISGKNGLNARVIRA